MGAAVAACVGHIHCPHLVGMGVLPCMPRDGGHAASPGLTGAEWFATDGIGPSRPNAGLPARATHADGCATAFTARARINAGSGPVCHPVRRGVIDALSWPAAAARRRPV